MLLKEVDAYPTTPANLNQIDSFDENMNEQGVDVVENGLADILGVILKPEPS